MNSFLVAYADATFSLWILIVAVVATIFFRD